jgi:hypothetical protein
MADGTSLKTALAMNGLSLSKRRLVDICELLNGPPQIVALTQAQLCQKPSG